MEEIEARALVDRQLTGAAIIAGAKGVTLVDPWQVRDRFDTWLVSEPDPTPAEDSDITRLFGLLGVAA